VSDRLDQLSAAIAAHLERVRGNLTDAEFATLVEELAGHVTRTSPDGACGSWTRAPARPRAAS